MAIMHSSRTRGFALPSVLIASVVMLGLLFTAVSAIAASRAAIMDQYYNQLAREAAESGVAMAEQCLRANNFEPQWTTTPLAPDKQCTGATITPTAPSAYMYEDSKICMTYSVPGPSAVDGGSVQFLIATGTVSLKRKTAGNCTTAWKTYTTRVNGRVGAEATFRNVALGYYANSGAFFGVIQPNGTVKTAGYNYFGQLGDGTRGNRNTPVNFLAPTTYPIRGLYTNFLSVGTRMVAVDSNGDAYASGYNYGSGTSALGIGSGVNEFESTPKKVSMPAGVKVKYVTSLTQSTFYFGDNNNIYAAGRCADGQLGIGSSCASILVPTRVALPTPSADPNTIPVTEPGWVQSTNVASDGNAVIVRMQGGAVYGWGNNQEKMLAQGWDTSAASYSTPQRMGSFGNSGQPKAIQVATDGVTSYVLDDTGTAYAAGENLYGQLAGAPSHIRAGNGQCLHNPGDSATSGRQVELYDCDGRDRQKLEFSPDGRIRFRPGWTNELCLEPEIAAPGVRKVMMVTCNSANDNQRWYMNDSGEIRNEWFSYLHRTDPASYPNEYCIDANVGGSLGIVTETCDGSTAQDWSPGASRQLTRVPIPASAGTVTRITTDERTVLFLTSSGQVWGAGSNEYGQLGNGETGKKMNPALVRYGDGVPAIRDYPVKDFYTTAYDSLAAGTGRANTFVIMNNGDVYGSGSNSDGQLGNGTTAPAVATPVKMNLPVRAGSIQSGLGTTIILSEGGRIYTVGNNSDGQLGDGTNTNSSTPQARKYLNVIPTTFF